MDFQSSLRSIFLIENVFVPVFLIVLISEIESVDQFNQEMIYIYHKLHWVVTRGDVDATKNLMTSNHITNNLSIIVDVLVCVMLYHLLALKFLLQLICRNITPKETFNEKI